MKKETIMRSMMFTKRIASLLVAIFLLSSTLSFAQSSVDDFQQIKQAKLDVRINLGKAAWGEDFGNEMLYGCLGATLGPGGILFAALSNPQMDYHEVERLRETRGNAYADTYASEYYKVKKTRNITNSAFGMIVWGAVGGIVYAVATN